MAESPETRAATRRIRATPRWRRSALLALAEAENVALVGAVGGGGEAEVPPY
jgi:hypothetical protein